ncbi:MAG: hypothetical protein AB7U29_04880 [Desulfobulbus sp.]
MIAALGQGLRRLLTTRVGWYVPAVFPVLLFILVHLLTLITFIFIHFGLVAQNHTLYTNMVTWAVYGFIPLLLCSYVCFFALARPGISILAGKFPQWSASNLQLVNGCVYGTSIGLALLVLLEPGVGPKSLLLFLIGLTSGVGNWQLYRRLVAVDPLAGLHTAKQNTDERVEE